MKSISLPVLLIIHMCVFFSESSGAVLNHNVQFPILYMFLSPKAETSVTDEDFKLSVSLDHTSIHIRKQSDRYDVLMDMEYTTLTPTLEFKVGKRSSILIEVPLVSMIDGFLDRPLADYHEFGDFGDYGRSLRPHNEFAYYIKVDGKNWFRSQKGSVALTDITASLKRVVLRSETLLFTLLYKIKLPTGNWKKGFGSGEIDHGFFLLSEYRFKDFILHVNTGYILVSDPKTLGADVRTSDVATLFTALEYSFNENLSFIVQLNGFTNHIKNSDIDNFQNDTVEGTIGFTYDITEDVRFEFSFSEDLTFKASAPDFTFQTGLTVKF